MKHIQEFERFAQEYQRYKIIQSRVAKYLVSHTPWQGKKILDIGAGSGEIYRTIPWEFEQFVAIDSSKKMLSLHPSEEKIHKIVCDFDTKECWQKLSRYSFDIAFSSSALQWSRNIDTLFYRVAQHVVQGAFAIFTSGTFVTIHRLLNITSPIYDIETLLFYAQRHFIFDHERHQYRLFFPSTQAMFRYIKHSGVSSGKKVVSIGQLRSLLKSYPYPYLEFEVLFLWWKSRYKYFSIS